jgi:hypothetical protein
VHTREFVAVLEGGIPQALQVNEATTAGAVLATLPADRRQAVRDALTRALEPHVTNGAVHLPSAANIAAARTPTTEFGHRVA